MPEFLTLIPPDQARAELLSHLPPPTIDSEPMEVVHALGRITTNDVFAPHPLPDFPRTTVDGYAVRAKDTFGASDSLPAYLAMVGEVPMGDAPSFELGAGQCALIHTGGMLPKGADAVVMIEYTQTVGAESEIFKSIADGGNNLKIFPWKITNNTWRINMAQKIKVLFDLNIILDVLQERKLFYETAAQLLAYAETGKIQGFVAPHSLTALFYLIRPVRRAREGDDYKSSANPEKRHC